MDNDLVRQHLLRQAGTISRTQAREAGLTDREIGGMLARREWVRTHPGVFRLHAAVPLPETSLWAAVLWLGPEVLLADETAAWWWGCSTSRHRDGHSSGRHAAGAPTG